MSRQKMLYKRLLDISLFVSYVMMILLLVALMYGVIVQAYDFSDSAPSMIKTEHRYLGSIIFSLVSFIVIFVIGARVFLAFIDNVENLESVSSYKLRILEEDRKRTRLSAKSPTRLKVRRKVQPEMVMEDNETSKMISIVKEKEEEISLFEKENEEETSSVESYQNDSNDYENAPDLSNDTQEEKAQPVEEIRESIDDNPHVEEEKTEVVEVQANDNKEVPVQNILVTKVKDDKKQEKEYYTRLTKSEINEIVSKITNLSMYKSRRFVNVLLNTIKEELIKGNEVSIDDFGKFSKKFVSEKQGVNPKTGEKIVIKEHHKVKFTPFKKFKDDITNDVVETKTKYLLTKTEEKKLSEDQVQNELIKEKIAEEHITVDVIQKLKPKTRKPKVPKKTKVDIIEYGSIEANISKNKMSKFLFALSDVVKEQLTQKEDITIEGFGKFTTVHIPAKDGVNPVTNEKIIVPEHNQVRLRFEKTFRDKINQK